MTDEEITNEILEHINAIYDLCKREGINTLIMRCSTESQTISFNNDYWDSEHKIDVCEGKYEL